MATSTPQRAASTARGAAPTTPPGATPGARPQKRKRLSSPVFPMLLVAPAIILLALFTVAPGIYALVLSLLQRKVGGGLLGGGTTTEVFVGFTNYITALADSELWGSLGRMLAVAVIGVPATIILALLFALCLDANRARLVGFARIAIFLPYAVPGVVASLLWGFLYLPATSPIGGQVVNYFGSTEIFFSVANIAVWGVVGFNMVIMYTALRGLPKEVFDAAHVDGANEFQIALRIKLPMIKPAVIMCALFSVLGGLQLFNEPMTLRPLANAISSTWVPLMKVYTDAFVNDDIHQAAATSMILVVLTIGASILVNSFGSILGSRKR